MSCYSRDTLINLLRLMVNGTDFAFQADQNLTGALVGLDCHLQNQTLLIDYCRNTSPPDILVYRGAPHHLTHGRD